MMRSLIASLLWAALWLTTATAGIVNNDGVTPEDSLAIAFQLLDSLGNPVTAASGDSAWLFVWYPGGGLATVDSLRLISDSRIAARQLTAGSRTMAFYTYRNAVADIDGAGLDGVYKWTFVVYDSSLALASTGDGEFQLYVSADYSALSDSTVKCNPIRTLNVDASGYIGLNWAAVSNTTANQTFTNTVIAQVTTVGALQGTVVLVDSSAHDLARLGNFHETDSALQYQTYARIDSVADTIEAHAPHGDNWAGIAESGSGAVPCTLQVVRTGLGDTTALEGVFLRVYNSDETATAATGTSDPNGRVLFALDADTFHVYGYQGGYAFAPQPETVIVIPGGVTDTVWATAFDPGAPVAAPLCRVYGWVSNLSGGGISGAHVRARATSSPLRYENLVISPYEQVTVSDTSGYWYLDLFPSASLDPATTEYQFEIRFESGTILRHRVPVPDSTQWFFTW